MKIENKENLTIVSSEESDLQVFVAALTDKYQSFAGQNLIVDVAEFKKLSAKDVSSFLQLAQSHKKAKKSFVVVANSISSATGKVVVVPTLQEAIDTVEMDEIERDLGF